MEDEILDLTEENLKKLQTELNEKYAITTDSSGKPIKLYIGGKDLNYLICLLSKINQKIKDDLPPDIVDFTKDLFKALRNCMVSNEESQNYFVSETNNLLYVKSLLQVLIRNNQSKTSFTCIKIIFQFLINLVVGNEHSSLKVWEVFSDKFVDLCETCDSYYTSALLYNVLIKHPKLSLDEKVCGSILSYFEHGKENEYVLFLVELFLKNDYISEFYTKFKLEHRIILLEMMKQKFIIQKDDTFEISEKQVQILSSEFKKKSDCILKTVPDYLKNIDAREVALLLEVLSSLTCQEKYLNSLQKDRSLLINCIFLLKSIHKAGKEGHSAFSPIQKLSEINNVQTEGSGVAFGFKADLIRLTGNLCWHHKANQDCVRELDGIPLILDCCNIDAKNPFIIQWSILAVRNLCEKNPENQKIIYSFKQEGVVESAVLEEFGLTLNADGENTLNIVPLDELRKHAK